jgi:hypothetical protein
MTAIPTTARANGLQAAFVALRVRCRMDAR